MAHPLAVAAPITLAADRTLTIAEIREAQIWNIDPGGAARNLVLPAVGVSAGLFLFIANKADAAEVITIQDAAAATVCTPTQNESAVVWCDGVTWDGGTVASS
jgi:hypothetical protein